MHYVNRPNQSFTQVDDWNSSFREISFVLFFFFFLVASPLTSVIRSAKSKKDLYTGCMELLKDETISTGILALHYSLKSLSIIHIVFAGLLYRVRYCSMTRGDRKINTNLHFHTKKRHAGSCPYII